MASIGFPEDIEKSHPATLCYGVTNAGGGKMKELGNPALLLTIISFCLFEFALQHQCGVFRQAETLLLQTQWMSLVCLAVWCGAFLFLTFRLTDLPLIVLLFIASILYLVSYVAWPAVDAITFFVGVTLGKGAQFLLKSGAQNSPSLRSKATKEESGSGSEVRFFLIGLVVLLAVSSWWHLDMSNKFYHGPRWMGLWDNPNDYGMLMGAGLTLAAGLLTASSKFKVQSLKLGIRCGEPAVEIQNSKFKIPNFFQSAIGNWKLTILFIAAGMIGVGLLFSYSRGAWAGTAIGLLYLAKVHGKFKWRFVLPGVFIVAIVAWFFWNATSDTAPWYLKRLDLSRPSVQHRIAALKAGFQMMLNHPFGVGWNKAVETYQKNYSPPTDGAAAIATNDYLMLGTQLGWPGLVCFVAYAALCFRSSKSKAQSPKSPMQGEDGGQKTLDIGRETLDSTKVTCRAGALAMLVTFWFDGGLFKLATATVFWILLELSSSEMVIGELEKPLKEDVATKTLARISSSEDRMVQRTIRARLRGFTLIEMLVVIAITGILAALLMPTLVHGKERARHAQCMNSLRQIDLALRMYTDSNGQNFRQVNAALGVGCSVGSGVCDGSMWRQPEGFYCPGSGFTEVDNLNLWEFGPSANRTRIWLKNG